VRCVEREWLVRALKLGGYTLSENQIEVEDA
jgi:hypothetical protein